MFLSILSSILMLLRMVQLLRTILAYLHCFWSYPVILQLLNHLKKMQSTTRREQTATESGRNAMKDLFLCRLRVAFMPETVEVART